MGQPCALHSKIGGIAVVTNEANKLIPTRTINIVLENQENNTFTYPYGTYAFRRMPFSLCNTQATFQKCVKAIFYDIVEELFEEQGGHCVPSAKKWSSGGIQPDIKQILQKIVNGLQKDWAKKLDDAL
ncbi:uncharacterized protein LOC107869025 [Capsicum annuum]|uniref:uncharacterized protein LOC107869025 n=1 Tax=Capsicum annuum TaxID=4072 RepID=UPI0007BFEC2A|nr:uncharacterized protein LOC107869025 [Capsicum annuum]